MDLEPEPQPTEAEDVAPAEEVVPEQVVEETPEPTREVEPRAGQLEVEGVSDEQVLAQAEENVRSDAMSADTKRTSLRNQRQILGDENYERLLWEVDSAEELETLRAQIVASDIDDGQIESLVQAASRSRVAFDKVQTAVERRQPAPEPVEAEATPEPAPEPVVEEEPDLPSVETVTEPSDEAAPALDIEGLRAQAVKRGLQCTSDRTASGCSSQGTTGLRAHSGICC